MGLSNCFHCKVSVTGTVPADSQYLGGFSGVLQNQPRTLSAPLAQPRDVHMGLQPFVSVESEC